MRQGFNEEYMRLKVAAGLDLDDDGDQY